MFAAVRTSVCLRGEEINQHPRSTWGDGEGKKWDAQIAGGVERLEPQVRHAGSGDPKFPLGIESGDWNPNEAILYSIHGTIHLCLEFLLFEVTDFSKISQIKYEQIPHLWIDLRHHNSDWFWILGYVFPQFSMYLSLLSILEMCPNSHLS